MQLLDVLFGFTAVMLLLSMLTTALVQAFSQFFAIRPRTTYDGIVILLTNQLDMKEERAKEVAESITRKMGQTGYIIKALNLVRHLLKMHEWHATCDGSDSSHDQRRARG